MAAGSYVCLSKLTASPSDPAGHSRQTRWFSYICRLGKCYPHIKFKHISLKNNHLIWQVSNNYIDPIILFLLYYASNLSTKYACRSCTSFSIGIIEWKQRTIQQTRLHIMQRRKSTSSFSETHCRINSFQHSDPTLR